MKIPEQIQSYQTLINQALNNQLKLQPTTQQQLARAIRYMVLGKGKRLRPILVFASGELFGVAKHILAKIACAVEFIHIYSLIHDDLPAMDNADLRHNKPSCHKAFNEATAILTGDALHCLAFTCLYELENVADKAKLKMITLLGDAVGIKGMVSGQAYDIATNGIPTLEELKLMYAKKTGALLKASLCLGCLAANNVSETQYQALQNFADHLGIAYQIQDDLLDIEGSQAIIGKPQGLDSELNKTTIPTLIGIQQAKKLVQTHYLEALEQLNTLPENSSLLRSVVNWMFQRSK